MPSQTASSIEPSFPTVLPLVSRDNRQILTVAHRGLWTHAPENSLASIRDAIAAGVEIVEIDAQATADGKLVVIHDDTLNRTSTGSGIVAELAFVTIRQAQLHDNDGGPDAKVTQEIVPTLAEALEEARGRIAVNIDTKFARDLPLIAAEVRRLSMQDQVILKTPVDPASEDFQIRDADWFGSIPHMPMFSNRPGLFAEDLRRIAPLAAPMIEVRFADIADLAAGREELDRQNIRLWINTLDVSHCLDFNDSRAAENPEAVWGVLADAGVGAIQTDTIAIFKNWLSRPRATGASL
jgi:glycerophosphoryl diester phosphodiesterase